MQPTRPIFRPLPSDISVLALFRLTSLFILYFRLLLISLSFHFAMQASWAQPAATKAVSRLKTTVPKSAPTSPEGVDPVTGTVHSQRLASGVPMGGIGTGTFQLLTDGTVAKASIANNWDHPLQNATGCFAAIWTRTENRSTAHVLALASAYKLPTVKKLDYDGLFPQAILTYPDADFPVLTSLLAFSPLVPFDLKNSSFPAATYVLRLKNPEASPVEVSVALSWESLLPNHSPPREGTRGTAAIIPSSEGFFGARFTGIGKKDKDAKEDKKEGGTMALLAYPQRAQAMVTTTLWDASESQQPKWWELFAREGRVSSEQVVVSGDQKTNEKTALTQVMELTRPAAVVAVRLTLKSGESLDLPFAVSWFLPHLMTPGGEDVGHYYETAFANAEDAGHRLLEDWTSLYGLTEEWQKRLTFSNLPRWSARRIVNAAAPLAANTIHTRDGRFAFLGTAGGEIAAQNGPLLLSALNALEAEREETRAHQTAEALLLTFYPQLAAQELTQFAAAQDSRGFIVPPATGDWGVRLGPAPAPRKPLIPDASNLFTIPTKNPTAKPETKRAKKKEEKNNEKTGPQKVVPPPAARPPSPSPALVPLDATAGYVLAMARLTLWAGDPDFLHKNYPHFRQAVLALLSLEQTFERPSGEKTSVGKTEKAGKPFTPSTLSLWLAALRAGQKIALMAEEGALARDCEAAVQRGIAQMETRYWNGEFYANSSLSAEAPGVTKETKTPGETKERKRLEKPGFSPLPADICAADQLWGQWLAYQLDLGPLALPEHLSRALQSLQQRNDRASSANGLKASISGWPSTLVRADGQPLPDGASDCLLPASILADASLNLWQEQPETGMTLLLRLETVRNNIARSPWLYPSRLKGGSEDTRASLAVASDWNLLNALEGFALDIYSENGAMTLTPHIPGTWRTFTAPIFAPTFWGRMEFRPAVHGGVTIFRLDRLIGFVVTSGSALLKNKAVLTLKTLRVLGPPRRQDGTRQAQITARVAQGQQPIGCTATLDANGFVTLTFDSLLKMTAGDRLEVEIH